MRMKDSPTVSLAAGRAKQVYSVNP
jgi:hypothetical protein